MLMIMFGFGVGGVCLYWTFGDGKLRQQQLANILIYLWILMLFGLVLGFIYWLIN